MRNKISILLSLLSICMISSCSKGGENLNLEYAKYYVFNKWDYTVNTKGQECIEVGKYSLRWYSPTQDVYGEDMPYFTSGNKIFAKQDKTTVEGKEKTIYVEFCTFGNGFLELNNLVWASGITLFVTESFARKANYTIL